MSSADYKRLESPTSILTYMQCPRRYFYRYVKRLEQRPSIHLLVGDVVHSTIADFHKMDIRGIPIERLFEILHAGMIQDLRARWNDKKDELKSLGLKSEVEASFYEEAGGMVDNFFQHHMNKVVAYQYRHSMSLYDAFEHLRPRTETKMVSEKYGVMGVIDAIHDIDGKVVIMDYKTSKKAGISEECLMQLALYALLYRECFGRTPDFVGIHFLRDGEKVFPVSPELLVMGESACHRMQALTRGQDVTIFPQRFSGLCKFRTGQCDHYEVCKPWNSFS